MPIEKLIPKFIFDEERIKQLKQIAPEAFADGKINWESLRECLGDHLEAEGQDAEHFGLFWPGKREARKVAALPSHGAIVPIPGEGIDEETTHNIFIEGENLEVLKLLQKSYGNPGRIKIIEIDPPYNTGNDFVYEDDFTEPLQEYLKRTGQLDEEGKPFSTNTRSDGRFHSKWLNMIYPRIRLARNLLREDGVIFVHIDDNEVHNLRILMGEIFGDENFIAVFPWKKRTTKSDVPFGTSQDYEWVVAFTKGNFKAGIPFERKYYQTKDFPNDRWRLSDLTTQRTAKERPNSAFNLIDPKTNKKYPFNPKRIWGVTKDTFPQYYKKGKIVFPDDYDFLNIKIPAYRVFESEDKQKAKDKYGVDDSIKPLTTHLPKEVGMNEDGNKEIVELFGSKIFSYPKPTSLIKYFLSSTNETEYIVLDFFAGSGSTGHAVFEKNNEDNGMRKFILVQLPEELPKESEAYSKGFKTLTDIGIERLKRVSKKIKKENAKSGSDLGFKVFKLTNSNYKSWNNFNGHSIEELEKQFSLFTTPLVEGWKSDELLFEILLLEGFPLDSNIELQKDYKKNKVNFVRSDFCEHKLLICLDKKIAPETVASLKLNDGDIFICLDSAISDQDKVRLSDKGLIKTI